MPDSSPDKAARAALPETMLAAVYRRYGPPEVVAPEEMPRPKPGPGEIIVRVEATAVNSADWRLRSVDVPRGFGVPMRLMFGWSRPRNPVLGMDAAGVVAELGEGVTRTSVGARVAVATETTLGAHAQYVRVPAKAPVVPIPEGVSFDHAAATLFGGNTALYFLDEAGVQAGQSLLINGATGAVGCAMVQLARLRGLEVTAVCSAANATLARELGATVVVDYQRQKVDELPGPYDHIAQICGNLDWAAAKPMLAPGGRLMLVQAPSLGAVLGAPIRGGGGRKVIAGNADASEGRIETLLGLCRDGGLRPVVDSTYPLAEVTEAHRRVETGHKVGAVLLHPFG